MISAADGCRRRRRYRQSANGSNDGRRRSETPCGNAHRSTENKIWRDGEVFTIYDARPELSRAGRGLRCAMGMGGRLGVGVGFGGAIAVIENDVLRYAGGRIPGELFAGISRPAAWAATEAIVGNSFPERADRILPNVPIARDDGQILDQRLGDEEAIKRVAMDEWQTG